MKTLLIITSIILISFQIDRLLIHNLSFITDSTEVHQNASPDLRIRVSEVEAPALSTGEKAVVGADDRPTVVLNKAPEIVEVREPKVVRSVEYGYAQVNKRNVQFHQQLKQSGNYLAMATLQYDINQYQNIDTEAFNNILKLADKLIFDASLKVSIAGFTDITGDQEYNQNLSRLRAVNVKNYMIDLGVKESQVIVSANGITFPVADNATPQGRATNRRVEMIIMK